MHRIVFLVLVALAATGCAGGSDSESAREQPPVATMPKATPAPAPAKPPRLYKKADLPRLGLQPADAPRGMRYTKEESGRKTFFDVGIVLDEQIAEARQIRLVGVYDAIFDSTTSDIRLASRTWLFAGDAGARHWLEKTRSDSQLFALEPISAPMLADGSWSAGGDLAGNAVISHGFRAGNVVVVVTMSTQTAQLSTVDALSAAQKAVARVRSA